MEIRRGSDADCLGGLECFLNICRAVSLGMGSCLSGAGGSSVPYAPASSSGSTKAKSSSRKRQMSRNFSFELKMEMWLHRIPGRMFLNGSTDVASLFTKQGRKGINQDAMIVWEVC